MNGPTLQVWFQARCTPILAVQRVSTILNHQRAPLLELRVQQDSGTALALIRLGSLEPQAVAQLVQRLARDWSVAAVQPQEPGRDRHFTRTYEPPSP